MEMSASSAYHYLIPLHDAEWGGGSAPHQTPLPLTLPWWAYQSTDDFHQTENGGTVFHSAPPILSLQRTWGTASLLLGRKGRLPLSLAPPRGGQSAVCFSEVEGAHGWQEWKLSFWFSPAKTTVVDRCGLSTGI